MQGGRGSCFLHGWELILWVQPSSMHLRDPLSFPFCPAHSDRKEAVCVLLLSCSVPPWGLSLGFPLKTGFLVTFKKHQLLFWYLSVGSCCPFPSYMLLLDAQRFSLKKSAKSHTGSRIKRGNWWCLRFEVLLWRSQELFKAWPNSVSVGIQHCFGDVSK